MGRKSTARKRWFVDMMRAPTICSERGCQQTNVSGTHYCEKHQRADQRTFTRTRDEVDRMYGRVRWFVFRKWILAGRPICQRINKGVRCTNAATLVHHIYSPRTHPWFFTSERHVLALCSCCHTPEEGTPHWRPGHEYEDEPLHGSWENYGGHANPDPKLLPVTPDCSVGA
jgi:hypothetical protein